jgi:hypothetical protein
MNAYPYWIQRIPAILNLLETIETEQIDRQIIERLFDVRSSAAKAILNRLGAAQIGKSFVISRKLLVKRLRQMARDPDYRFEVDRRARVLQRIEDLKQERAGRAKVVITDQNRNVLALRSVASLPETVRLSPGRLEITSADMDDLMKQLLAVILAIDRDYERMKELLFGETNTP